MDIEREVFELIGFNLYNIVRYYQFSLLLVGGDIFVSFELN